MTLGITWNLMKSWCRPAGKTDPALALRLIIQRKTPAATAATRLTLAREASRKQKTLDPRSLLAAEFLILATLLPAGTPTMKAKTAHQILRETIILTLMGRSPLALLH